MPGTTQNDKKQAKKDKFFLFSKTKAKKLIILLVRIKKSLTFAAILKEQEKKQENEALFDCTN